MYAWKFIFKIFLLIRDDVVACWGNERTREVGSEFFFYLFVRSCMSLKTSSKLIFTRSLPSAGNFFMKWKFAYLIIMILCGVLYKLNYEQGGIEDDEICLAQKSALKMKFMIISPGNLCTQLYIQ